MLYRFRIVGKKINIANTVDNLKKMRKEIINQKENLVQNKINFELSMMAVDVVEIMDGLSVTVDLWFHLTQFIFL